MNAHPASRGVVWLGVFGVVALVVFLGYSWTVGERSAASKAKHHEIPFEPSSQTASPHAADNTLVPGDAAEPDSIAARAKVDLGGRLQFWVDGAASKEPERTEVTWSPLTNDVLGRWTTRTATLDLFFLEVRSRRISADSTGASADSRGAVAIAPPGALGDAGSVVWITHPRALPTMLELTAAPDSWPRGQRLELAPAEPSSVRIVDGDGRPIEGALVRRQALPATDFRPPVTQTEQIAVRALARETRSGADGVAELAPFGLPQEVRVEAGALRARLVLEEDPRGLEIVLRSSFELGGHVEGAAGLGPWPAVVVDAFHEDGSPLGRVAALSIDQLGNFATTQLPLAPDVHRYRLSLAHSDAYGETWLPRPEPGSSHRVRLDATVGLAVWFEVLDAQTQIGVLGADVRLIDGWSGPAWERGTVETGHAYFTGVPTGLYHVEAVAPGYALQRSAFELNASTAQRSWSIELQRPGRIEGRVLDGGLPAARFRVSASAPDHRGLPFLHDVRGSEDGAFAWEGLAPGTYDVHATVLGQRISEVHQVQVQPGQATNVELAILGTAHVHGVVVDALNRAPVGGASVAVVLVGTDGPIDTLVDGVLTAADGRFEIVGFPVRSAQLVIDSPSHFSSWLTPPDLGAGGVHELGELALEPRYTIAYVLRGGEDLEPELYALRGAGSTSFVAFPADGRLPLERESSSNLVELKYPTGEVDSYTQVEEVLRGGEVVLDVREGPLLVEVAGGEAKRYLVDIRWRSPRIGWAVRTIETARDGLAESVGVPSDRVHVAVVQPGTFELLAVHQSSLDANGGGRIRVDLTQGVFRLRVRDRQGRPVPWAPVALDGSDPNQEQWIPHARTNEAGECDLVATPELTGYLWVTDPSGARIVQRPVLTPGPGETLDVVFDAETPLHIEAASKEGPVTFAEVALRAPRGPSQFFRGRTDSDGRAQSLPVAGEPLLLEIAKPGYWSYSQLVVPPLDGGTARVEMRAVGTLALRVLDGDGVPVVGAAVDLEHTEVRQHDSLRGALGGHVGAWMGAGWLTPQMLVSDGLGRVVLEGLPEGDYRVSVTADQRSAFGSARVGAGAAEAVFVLGP